MAKGERRGKNYTSLASFGECFLLLNQIKLDHKENQRETGSSLRTLRKFEMWDRIEVKNKVLLCWM